MSANFRPVFVHGISYRSTNLSLLIGLLKRFSFEDFHYFHEICPDGGIFTTMTVINFETL